MGQRAKGAGRVGVAKPIRRSVESPLSSARVGGGKPRERKRAQLVLGRTLRLLQPRAPGPLDDRVQHLTQGEAGAAIRSEHRLWTDRGGKLVALDVDLIAQNGEPVSATGSPGFTIAGLWIGRMPCRSSLRAVPGTRDSIEYRPRRIPPAGARGRVWCERSCGTKTVPAEHACGKASLGRVPTQDCGTGTAHSPVFVGGNELGEFLLEWTGAPADVIGPEYRHRPKWDPDPLRRATHGAVPGRWEGWRCPGQHWRNSQHRVIAAGQAAHLPGEAVAATGPGMPYDPVEVLDGSRDGRYPDKHLWARASYSRAAGCSPATAASSYPTACMSISRGRPTSARNSGRGWSRSVRREEPFIHALD